LIPSVLPAWELEPGTMVALQRVKQEALRLILEEVLRAVLQP